MCLTAAAKLLINLQEEGVNVVTSAPITVAILANGKLIGMTPAADERLDVGAAHPRYGPDHGFRVAVPIPTDTLGVCVAAVGTGSGVGMNTIGCRPTK